MFNGGRNNNKAQHTAQPRQTAIGIRIGEPRYAAMTCPNDHTVNRRQDTARAPWLYVGPVYPYSCGGCAMTFQDMVPTSMGDPRIPAGMSGGEPVPVLSLPGVIPACAGLPAG